MTSFRFMLSLRRRVWLLPSLLVGEPQPDVVPNSTRKAFVRRQLHCIEWRKRLLCSWLNLAYRATHCVRCKQDKLVQTRKSGLNLQRVDWGGTSWLRLMLLLSSKLLRVEEDFLSILTRRQQRTISLPTHDRYPDKRSCCCLSCWTHSPLNPSPSGVFFSAPESSRWFSVVIYDMFHGYHQRLLCFVKESFVSQKLLALSNSSSSSSSNGRQHFARNTGAFLTAMPDHGQTKMSWW